MRRALPALLALLSAGCVGRYPRFSEHLSFLRDYTDVYVLSDPGGKAQVAVCPDLQGRVMTSTLDGPGGYSFGWVNEELIASGRTRPHINAYGGEDRLWLGPEGSRYSIFFAPNAPFDLDHWFTPAPFDTEAFPVVTRDDVSIVFRKGMDLFNRAGTAFRAEVRREVRLLSSSEAWQALGVAPVEGVKMVAFESSNTLINDGEKPWARDSGLLSVWILGMFRATRAVTVVVPLRDGPGPSVNDAYFGKVPEDRLVERNGFLFFRGDAAHRSKIGVPPGRASNVLGSYDTDHDILTVVQFTLPEGADAYVNSLWTDEADPYAGDVSNSYNDGPPPDGGAQLGSFYELESSSPAAELAPGASLTHVHRTMHFRGAYDALDEIARGVLGVRLGRIRGIFER